MINSPNRYRTFSSYLKQQFGGPVRKLSLDAGFTCPNRDGSLSDRGCIFCEPRSFSPNAVEQGIPLITQVQQGIRQGQAQGVERFIAYFQSYTNTYAPIEILKKTYDSMLAFPEIKALAIGTRPDCVNPEILQLLTSYTPVYEVWLEYGLQSMHDSTLAWMNRGHDSAAFLKAVALTRAYPKIKICAHVILGMPGESEADEGMTAETLARLQVEGVKLHPLHAVKNTQLADEYLAKRFIPISLEAYVRRVVLFLERLYPATIIQRLTADCLADTLLAPEWIKQKALVLTLIRDLMERDDTWQGKKYSV